MIVDSHLTTRLAEEYVSKNAGLGSRTIARMLRTDHPEIYSSIEAARGVVRYVRGAHGAKKKIVRENVGKADLFREPGTPGDFQIPDGIKQTRHPLELNKPAKYLVLSDIHVPYHDELAVRLAIETGISQKCDSVYLNGDSIDFYKLSRFVQDPRARSPRQEVDTLLEIMSVLESKFARRYYKCGNHEERWQVYLYQRAEDLIGFDEFELSSVLHCRERGWTFIHSKQWARMGHLNVLHGHEFVRGFASPVNPARGAFLKLKDTVLVGHLHRPSQHNESHPIRKESTTTWSQGCLCDLRPDYAPLNDWAQGFAIVEVLKDQRFRVSNYLIEKGQVYDI